MAGKMKWIRPPAPYEPPPPPFKRTLVLTVAEVGSAVIGLLLLVHLWI